MNIQLLYPGGAHLPPASVVGESDESECPLVVSNSSQPHGILQARILRWVAFPFSRGSSQPRNRTQVSHITGGFFASWAIKEALNSGEGTREL